MLVDPIDASHVSAAESALTGESLVEGHTTGLGERPGGQSELGVRSGEIEREAGNPWEARVKVSP